MSRQRNYEPIRKIQRAGLKNCAYAIYYAKDNRENKQGFRPNIDTIKRNAKIIGEFARGVETQTLVGKYNLSKQYIHQMIEAWAEVADKLEVSE